MRPDYMPYLCYIAGSLCFIVSPQAAKVGPWFFIIGSVVAMGQLP